MIACICYSQKRFAPVNIKLKEEEKPTPNKKDGLISQASFSKLLRQTFGQVATGQSSSGSLANYASLDIVQGRLNFNGSIPIHNNFILTTALAGKIDNSVSQLFSNFKINNNTNIDTRLYFLIPKGTIFFTNDDRASLKSEISKIDLRFIDDSSRLVNNINLSTTKLELMVFTLNSLKRREAELERLISNNKSNLMLDSDNQPQNLAAADDYQENMRKLLETRKAIGEAKLQIDSLQYSDKHQENYRVGAIKDLDRKRRERIEEAELNASWNAIQLQWISFRVNLSRSKFFMLDTLKAFNKQVFDTVLTNAFFGIEYSYYYYSRKRKMAHYFNLGAGFSHTDNRSQLDTYEVTDSWKRDSARTSRSYSSKVNAYNGELTEDICYTFYGNYYVYLLNKNTLGMHVFPDIQWREGYGPQYNAGIGIVFSFKKKDDEKTIINAEPYFKLIDISNVHGKTMPLVRRNEMGIRIGVPFNPDIAKKKQ